MIEKATHPHLTHATGNNITKRKRADEVSAIGMEHAARPVNFVVDCVDERWVQFAGLSPQDALG